MTSCPGCQAAVAADSRFCPRCGRQLVTVARCTRCQAELPAGARFCPACGQAVTGV
jgi:predicted amidophosphoribosyltransferase